MQDSTARPDIHPARPWSRGARRAVSLGLVIHLTALLVGAFGPAPASPLETGLYEVFRPYFDVTGQGKTYRYYAPEPGPTPVVEARLIFADGRAERVLRLPERADKPRRMLYQRQLALAYHLDSEYRERKGVPADVPEEERPLPRWARSYARHLGRVYGCSEVEFTTHLHLIPPLGLVRQRMAESGRAGFDLDAEESFAVPEVIGVYPCDGS